MKRKSSNKRVKPSAVNRKINNKKSTPKIKPKPYVIRKAIKSKSSVVINIPKSICQKMDLFGANIKLKIVGKKLIITKIKDR